MKLENFKGINPLNASLKIIAKVIVHIRFSPIKD